MNQFNGEIVTRTDYFERFRPADGVRVKLGSFNLLVFARMLAKIAHSYAVATIGLDAFTPMLPVFILGGDDRAAYVVGGDVSSFAPSEPEARLHSIHIQGCKNADQEYILVAIRLFAFAGMPQYHVVVGTPQPHYRIPVSNRGDR